MAKGKKKEERRGEESQEKIARKFSAGGAVVKKKKEPRTGTSSVRGKKDDEGKVLWLVTKSTPSEKSPKSKWRLPKGWLDDENDGIKPGPLTRGERKATEEELQKAAIREVKEEGGVEVKIIEKIGTDRYFFTLQGKKILKFVTFYLMEYLNDSPDGFDFETEEVTWLVFEKARKKLSHSGERKILDKAKEILEAKSS